MSTTTSSGNSADARRAQAWAPQSTPLDSGAVFDVTPQLAVQPNGGGGAVAVWIKRVDLDPADSLPAVYHLYATHLTSGVPDATDSACPAGGFPFGNPDATGNDGVCVIDTGSAQYDAWSPKVSMDNNGDAIVVWQQHDGTAQRVYARRFTGGSWGALQQLNDSIEFTNFDAADPAIALEPDPTNNGAPDDGVGSAMAAWSQYNEKDWVQVFNSDLTSTNEIVPTNATGTNWTGPTNVFSSDNVYAVYNNTSQDDLCATGFGFGFPTTENIRGIIVSVEGNGTSATPADRQYRIGLTKSGCTLDGTRKTGIQMNQTTDTVTNTGNSYDLWGTTWTPADINASSFGVLISDNDATAQPLNIDKITVTIVTDSSPQCQSGVDHECASVNATAVYNGQLYAGLGNSFNGSSDVYVYDPGSNRWSYSFNDGDAVNGYPQVISMAVYNGKLYVGLGDIFGNNRGDIRVFDGTTWTTLITNNLTCAPVPCANTGGPAAYDSVRSMAVYNNQLYIGMGSSSNGDGDVWRCTSCDGSDWQKIWDSTVAFTADFYGSVDAMTVYQCPTCSSPQLYIGMGSLFSSQGTADVLRCTQCDGTDWAKVLDNPTTSPYKSVSSLAVHNGQLYIGYGYDLSATTGTGDIRRCTKCDGSDWSGLVFDASTYAENYEAVVSMISYNGLLYIGLGATGQTSGTPGHGDIKRCRVCDGTDWTNSRNDAATYESVHTFAVYNGDLYAGFGNSILRDGDIFKFAAGWQTVARRFVNGVGWDTLDTTVCPAGSGVNDGICYISGLAGTSVQPTEAPRVAMDNAGRAVAAFVQMVRQANCITGTDPTDTLTIACIDSTLQANLFNAASWSSPIDLDPGLSSVAAASQLICFENGILGGTSTDACVNVIEYDLSVSPAGQAALLIKTAWKSNEDFELTNPPPQGCGDNRLGNNTNCIPNGNAFEDYMGQAIVARQYTMGAAWNVGNWPLTRLANFGYANGTNFGTGPFPAGCPSSATIDGGRVILNCRFDNPRIAPAAAGTTVVAVYESYNGTNNDILAHRYDGATWGAFSTVDAGGGDAHAPQIAMDNSGDGVAVWTQNDGAKFRIYSNCYAPAAGIGTCGNVVSTGWQGAANVDGDVGSESAYYSPVVGLPGPGGAGSALSLFLGWSLLDNSTRLYYATGP
ncbi:MAG: hypothetical protein HY203_08120 [Nitrospirae bacterium]|nr:hypothetical protein [Nitrospirota bacterium]